VSNDKGSFFDIENVELTNINNRPISANDIGGLKNRKAPYFKRKYLKDFEYNPIN
jgi:hypothetical protein